MTYETVSLEEFCIIGLSARTCNKNGQSRKDQMDLWEIFLNQDIMELIPNKASSDIYCMYTNYENDSGGHFTIIIGCKVDSLGTIPDNLSGKIIPATTYRVYTAKGKVPECLVDTWDYIRNSTIPRKYASDFDVYGPAAENLEAAEIRIFVSVETNELFQSI